MTGLVWALLALAPAAPAELAEPAGRPAAPPLEVPAATFADELVVTAARREQPRSEAAQPVTVIDAGELARSASPVLDGALGGRLPGFSLFRRSSSLAAHPTTQGVSLRGIAASGAGRSLVLLDGVPLDDPFGGWVLWNRVPPAVLERVEVATGAASALYGSAALGGAVQLLTRPAGGDGWGLSARAGGDDSGDLEGWASRRTGGWELLAAGRRFESAGHSPLREGDRGAVDRLAGLAFDSLYLRLRRAGWRAGAQLYGEERGGGTAASESAARLRLVEAGHDGARARWRLYAEESTLESTFTAVAPGRGSERITAVQRFPATGLGASATWDAAPGLLVGADWRRAAWDGREQHLAGALIQATGAPSERLSLLAGGRLDLWQNDDTRGALSPRLGLAYRPAAGAVVRASVYRGFRAPTLNELYRPFRVGDVETLANPGLDAERLTGAEAGAEVEPAPWLRLTAGAYWNRLDGAIGNVTLESGPAGVLRQRRNLGTATVRGIEAAAEARAGRWCLAVRYLGADSEVAATGRRLAQTPGRTATLTAERVGPIWAAALLARWEGERFEDDRNALRLPPALTVDLRLERRLGGGLRGFAAVENLFDEEVIEGRTPLDRLGPPRRLWLGVRWSRDRETRAR